MNNKGCPRAARGGFWVSAQSVSLGLSHWVSAHSKKAKGKRTATCNDPPWPPSADPLLFITFIIGTTADSCDLGRDPESTPSGPRAAFIIHYVYYFYYGTLDLLFLLF